MSRQTRPSRGPSPIVKGPSPDDWRLVEVLEDQVEHLRVQLAAKRDANRENRCLLAALERILAIEAARDRPQAPESAPEAPRGAGDGAGGASDGRTGDRGAASVVG